MDICNRADSLDYNHLVKTMRRWFKIALLGVSLVVTCKIPEPVPDPGKLIPPDSLWMDGATLTWTSVDFDSLWGYRVYKGRSSGGYGYPYFILKAETSVTFQDLVKGIRYYTAVTTVDSALKESEKSREINFIWQQDTTIDKYAIRLWWDPNTENDLAGYKVYRGIRSRDYGWRIDVGNVTEYIDSCEVGTYCWAVTAYDTADNESDFSNEVFLMVTRGNELKLGTEQREPGKDFQDQSGSGGANKLE